jgi:hypothetical protein
MRQGGTLDGEDTGDPAKAIRDMSDEKFIESMHSRFLPESWQGFHGERTNFSSGLKRAASIP